MRSIHRRRLPLLLCIPVAAVGVVKAQFNGPESVEHDAAGDRYLVSNTQSNSIKILDQEGQVSDLVTALPNAPYGLEIMGGVLYVCMGDGVRGYSLDNGEEVYYRDLDATFPNGITNDGEHLYITDFGAQRIYKVDPVGDSHSTLVTSTGGTPNGIVFDPVADRLVVVFWGTNAAIRAFDRNNGESTTLVAASGLSNIDGITIDCRGDFLTASWSPDRITRWDPTFTQPGVDLQVPGIGDPADIGFDHVNNRVAIPNTSLNTVILYDIDCSTGTPVSEREKQVVIPNPVRDLVQVEPPFDRPEPYILLDVRGLLIGGGVLQPRGMIDLGALAAGSYSLHFTRTATRVRLVKE